MAPDTTMEMKVLIIDDDREDVELLCEIMREVDSMITCVTLTDSTLSMNQLAAIVPPPAMIFLDINMPLMNGYEILSAIRSDSRHSDTAVVMLSTTMSSQEEMRLKLMGAQYAFRKPSSYEAFLSLIRSVFITRTIEPPF